MIKRDQRLCEGLRLAKASPIKYFVYYDYNQACAGNFVSTINYIKDWTYGEPP
jgi:hypothetical protein